MCMLYVCIRQWHNLCAYCKTWRLTSTLRWIRKQSYLFLSVLWHYYSSFQFKYPLYELSDNTTRRLNNGDANHHPWTRFCLQFILVYSCPYQPHSKARFDTIVPFIWFLSCVSQPQLLWINCLSQPRTRKVDNISWNCYSNFLYYLFCAFINNVLTTNEMHGMFLLLQILK
jgi:hypothetical protein